MLSKQGALFAGCPECSGEVLARVLSSRALSTLLFKVRWCKGAVQGAVQGAAQVRWRSLVRGGALQGAVQGQRCCAGRRLTCCRKKFICSFSMFFYLGPMLV